MAVDYSQLQGGRLSREQAKNMAELVTTYMTIAPQTNGKFDLTGLANLIQRDGLQAGVDWAKSAGADFRINRGQVKTPYPVAKELVDRLYKDANFSSVSHYQGWLNSAQGLTVDEFLERWNNAQTKDTTKSKLTPEEIETFTTRAQEELPKVIQSDLNNFIQSANKIYQGYDLTPNYGPETDANKLIAERLNQAGYTANQTDLDRWNLVAERYGVGAAIAQMDRALALRNLDKAIPKFAQEEGFEGIKLTGQLPSTYLGASTYQDINYAGTTGNPLLKPPTTQEALVPLSSVPATSVNPLVGTGSTTSSGIPIQGVPTPTLPQTSAPTNIPIQGVPTPQIPSTSSFINTALSGQSRLPSLEAATPVTQGPRPTEQPMPQPMPTSSIFSSLPAPQPLVGTFGSQPLVPQPQVPVQQAPQPQMTNEEFIQQQQAPVQMADGGSVGGASSGVRRLKMSGYQDGGDVSNDEYIQQMMTGTPPEDMETEPGLLPPELRKGVDVPLDLLNTILRGTAGAVGGPAYGLYKGVTSDKFGTKEGVKEARSEAERMMAEISGEPKTEEVRNLMEKLGQLAEEAKIPPLPQFLTTPAPGPGSASALMRSYELAETPPTGTVKLADKGAKPVATPPTDPLGFYSPAEKVVMNLSQEKGTAQQMLAQISKAQGVKPVELRATGLEDYLKGKGNEPVTKQEIQDFLRNNQVQVDEVVLGKGQVLSPEAKQRMAEAENRMIEIDNELINAPYFKNVSTDDKVGDTLARLRGPLARKAAAGDAEAMAEIDALNLPPEIKQLVLDFGEQKNEYGKYSKQARKMVKPKFDQYNIPGGENAREIYLTLPRRPVAPVEGGKSPARMLFEREMVEKYGTNDFTSTYNRLSPAEVDKYEMYVREDRNAAKTESILRDRQTNYTVPSAHSVSPEADKNRLAHIFLDDRADAEGNKTLFVQELQSDWAQQGRDKGFAKTFTPDQLKAEEILPKPPGPPVWKVTYPDGNQSTFAANSANEAIEFAIQREGRVGLPPAPFVTNTEDWLNLALKRVIKEAVDTGADNVAFIKGEQAAEKYSLNTVLDSIEVMPLLDNRLVDLKRKGGGAIELTVDNDGKVVQVDDHRFFGQFANKPLSEIIGKEMAEKAMTVKSSKGKESVEFSAEDMVVGGEGMKGFYDNILPKTAEKLLKRLGGGKVEPLQLDAEDYLGFKITPEMREMVQKEGLPKFAAGGEVTDFIKRVA